MVSQQILLLLIIPISVVAGTTRIQKRSETALLLVFLQNCFVLLRDDPILPAPMLRQRLPRNDQRALERILAHSRILARNADDRFIRGRRLRRHLRPVRFNGLSLLLRFQEREHGIRGDAAKKEALGNSRQETAVEIVVFAKQAEQISELVGARVELEGGMVSEERDDKSREEVDKHWNDGNKVHLHFLALRETKDNQEQQKSDDKAEDQPG